MSRAWRVAPLPDRRSAESPQATNTGQSESTASAQVTGQVAEAELIRGPPRKKCKLGRENVGSIVGTQWADFGNTPVGRPVRPECVPSPPRRSPEWGRHSIPFGGDWLRAMCVSASDGTFNMSPSLKCAPLHCKVTGGASDLTECPQPLLPGPTPSVPRRAVMGRVPVPHPDPLPVTRFYPAAARRGKGGPEAHPGGTRSALPAHAPQAAC